MVFHGDANKYLDGITEGPTFDLVVTSPPYNLGKEYEKKLSIDEYVRFQCEIIQKIVPRLKPGGSVCWQVGNYIDNGHIEPLDMILHPIFKDAGLTLRNRIIWHFGHGFHCKRRFSGRYEVVLWYTASETYTFNLDAVRVSSKYPGKRSYKGPRRGELSGHPLGKNPEDVWNIPNVVGNHREKTEHPCQFPVGLIERLILALSNPNDLVFDPFCGVGSSGVAAISNQRRFIGCEVVEKYVEISCERLEQSVLGCANYRPHQRPVFDHTKSALSVRPAI
jgi:adenine-specific DNA-methyltransferase